MIRSLALLTLFSAIYGFGVGLSNGVVFAVRNTVKLPMLLLSTALICSLCYLVIARFLGARLSLADVMKIVVSVFSDTSRLLASLSPVVCYLALTMEAADQDSFGGFPQFMAFNVLAIATCGALAVWRRSRQHLRDVVDAAGTRKALIAAWLIASLAVGGQMCWLIRPFFGVESTADWDWPWFSGAEPGFRGARSFYEAVYYLLAPPDGYR